jgi:hypothetical protein
MHDYGIQQRDVAPYTRQIRNTRLVVVEGATIIIIWLCVVLVSSH